MLTHARCGAKDDLTGEYRPREPEQSLVYRVLQENLETYLARQKEKGRDVPKFVERELRGVLECGVLACGFLRLQCEVCKEEKLLPFSCKGRAACSSCCGRRMADTAAHLVEHVFPRVPVRQWVLSLPFSLRYRLAYSPSLLTAVYGIRDLPSLRSVAYLFAKRCHAKAESSAQREYPSVGLRVRRALPPCGNILTDTDEQTHFDCVQTRVLGVRCF